MEAVKGPGIAIEQIRLVLTHVEMVDPDGEPRYNLRLTDLQRLETDAGKGLHFYTGFDVMHGIEKPLFKFTCGFVAHYTRESDAGMAWKDFTSAMALAHIVPYLREYVSNTTTRLPAPVLMLAPINTQAMIDDYEKRKNAGKQGVAVGPVKEAPPSKCVP